MTKNKWIRMKWFANLSEIQLKITRVGFVLLGIFGLILLGFWFMAFIYIFWIYLEVNDLWTAQNRERRAVDISEEKRVQRKIDAAE